MDTKLKQRLIGGAVLVGSYVYGYLRRAGAPVPTGEEIGEIVAGAVNAAV